jgi:hypothetical protein
VKTLAARAFAAVVMGAALIAACATGGGSASWVNDPGYRAPFDARFVRSQIAALRARANLAPPQPFQVMEFRVAMMQRRVEQGTPPEVAMEYSLQNAADDGERDVRTYILRVDGLDSLKVPPELLHVPRLNLSVAVFRQLPGHHPRYVVLLITPSLNNVRIDI